MGDVGWELDLPAVGKLKISQMDAQRSFGAATALDHVSCPDREPARETVCEGAHAFLLGNQVFRWELAGTNAGSPRQFRDIRAANAVFCESLWTRRPMC